MEILGWVFWRVGLRHPDWLWNQALILWFLGLRSRRSEVCLLLYEVANVVCFFLIVISVQTFGISVVPLQFQIRESMHHCQTLHQPIKMVPGYKSTDLFRHAFQTDLAIFSHVVMQMHNDYKWQKLLRKENSKVRLFIVWLFKTKMKQIGYF